LPPVLACPDDAPRPRNRRASQGGYYYSVRNRGNGRRTLLDKDGDCAAFVKLLRAAGERTPVRLRAYCPSAAVKAARLPSAGDI